MVTILIIGHYFLCTQSVTRTLRLSAKCSKSFSVAGLVSECLCTDHCKPLDVMIHMNALNESSNTVYFTVWFSWQTTADGPLIRFCSLDKSSGVPAPMKRLVPYWHSPCITHRARHFLVHSKLWQICWACQWLICNYTADIQKNARAISSRNRMTF